MERNKLRIPFKDIEPNTEMRIYNLSSVVLRNHVLNKELILYIRVLDVVRSFLYVGDTVTVDA